MEPAASFDTGEVPTIYLRPATSADRGNLVRIEGIWSVHLGSGEYESGKPPGSYGAAYLHECHAGHPCRARNSVLPLSPVEPDHGGSASSLSYLSRAAPSLRLRAFSRTFGRAPVAVRESRGPGLALLALFLPEMLGLLWVTASVPAS